MSNCLILNGPDFHIQLDSLVFKFISNELVVIERAKLENFTLSNLHSNLFAKIHNVKTIKHGLGGILWLCVKTFHINIQHEHRSQYVPTYRTILNHFSMESSFLSVNIPYSHNWPFSCINFYFLFIYITQRKGWFHFQIIWIYFLL